MIERVRAHARVALPALLAGLVLGALVGPAAFADEEAIAGPDNVPRLLPYSGFVEIDGEPVDGAPFELRLTLSDTRDHQWSDTLEDVVADRGHFSVLVGADPANPLPAWVADADPLVLTAAVDGQELPGRQRIAAQPFALKAAKLSAPPEMTLQVSPGGRLPTVNAALALLDGRWIPAGQTVVIRVADGRYDDHPTIRLQHPQGSQIRIVGNTDAPGEVVLTFDSTGIYLDGGNNLGHLDGVTLLWTGAHPPTAAGISVRSGSAVSTGRAVVIDGFQDGVAAGNNGTAFVNGIQVANAHRYGMLVTQGSTIDLREATLSGAGTACVHADSLAYANARNADASDCGEAAYRASTGSFVDAQGADWIRADAGHVPAADAAGNHHAYVRTP